MNETRTSRNGQVFNHPRRRVAQQPNRICLRGGGSPLGPVKVGRSADAKRRLAHLQIGHHSEMAVQRAWRMQNSETPLLEGLLHRLLAPLRLRGEWFDIGVDEVGSLVDYILADAADHAAKLATIIVQLRTADNALYRLETNAPRNRSAASYWDDKRAWETRCEAAQADCDRLREAAYEAGLRPSAWDISDRVYPPRPIPVHTKESIIKRPAVEIDPGDEKKPPSQQLAARSAAPGPIQLPPKPPSLSAALYHYKLARGLL